MSKDSWDFWSDFRSGSDQDAAWPAFTQAAVRADLDEAVAGVTAIAADFGMRGDDVTQTPEQWEDGVCFARRDDLTVMTEPGVDIDERFVTAETTERLVDHLEADGAMFGYDPAAGTLMLTVFSSGTPMFTWADSLEPGPSHAITFHADGTATDEDPRRFALRRLGQPETSPFLDRYAFVENELAKLGLTTVQPDLADVPVSAVVHLEMHNTRHHG